MKIFSLAAVACLFVCSIGNAQVAPKCEQKSGDQEDCYGLIPANAFYDIEVGADHDVYFRYLGGSLLREFQFDAGSPANTTMSNQILSILLTAKTTGKPIRIWVPLATPNNFDATGQHLFVNVVMGD